ncbi:hypothetical protein PG994_006898 [Apiospora phragmitis]|uniref:F-box domain-containing protein n=1 Tax=Apiospora phragmitis TaxID=2905665 RepID=A0ABR1VHD8_9PEZI
MNLPLDILEAIALHLPPETAVALGLTCKAALDFFEPKRPLRHSQQKLVLQLLERDHGERCYYCWSATISIATPRTGECRPNSAEACPRRAGDVPTTSGSGTSASTTSSSS